ncbi:MAG: C1 family peptidase [Marinifilaceae bacterium]
MKKLLLMAAIALFASASFAQNGNITAKEMNKITTHFTKDANTRALQNAIITHKDLRSMAENHDIAGKVDHFFKYKVKVTGITNQHSSGRCWMFTSMNTLRPRVISNYSLKDFDFSHNYLYFWDIFEKSNLFLENIIATAKKPMGDREVVTYFKDPVSDGGVWNSFYNLATKYGVVPQSVMPETAHSNNTSQMGKLIKEKMRQAGYQIRTLAADGKKTKALRKYKVEVLADVYRILSLCLGEPPVDFTWRFKNSKGEIKSITSTPMKFFKAITPEDYTAENYIMVMNDPTREYYKVYEIKNYRNTMEGMNWTYLNLPNDEIKASALKSIKNNEALYTSSDVGKQFNRKTGILDVNNYNYNDLMGVNFDMEKKARILTRQSGSAHAMALIGCDTDENGKTLKWEFENSWGRRAGHNGYLTLTDKWFDEYIFRIILHKKYMSPKAVKALKGKKINLPVWDYMF